jgi:hypothetical protein
LPPSFSILFLCYNHLFSLTTTLSTPSHPLSSPSSTSTPILPKPVTILSPLLHTHHPLTSFSHNHTPTSLLQCLRQTLSSTTVEIYLNTNNGYKTQ